MADDPTAEEIDTWLDSIEVDPDDARDAVHLRRIMAARRAADDAEAELEAAVQAAREAGEPWTVIGVGLGTTGQKAEHMFDGLSRRRRCT